MSRYYENRRVTVDSVTWTAVVVPTGVWCSRITIENTDPMVQLAVRTDQADANTEVPIYPGAMKSIVGASEHGTQFSPGDTICYVKAASGTGPIAVEFIR